MTPGLHTTDGLDNPDQWWDARYAEVIAGAEALLAKHAAFDAYLARTNQA